MLVLQISGCISKQYHRLSLSLIEKPLKHQTQFNQILSQAITSGLFTEPFISSKLLLNSLSHFPDLNFSQTIFSQIQNPNVFAYNFMLKSFSRSQNVEKTLTLFNRMLCNGVLPDKYTFPFVLKACGRLVVLEKGQEVHCLSIKLGLERDALNVFVEMLNDTYVNFYEVSLASVLNACGNMGFKDLGRSVHGLIIKLEFSLHLILGSSLIDMYAKCGSMKDAHEVFDRIVDKSVVCWTSMITGYARLHLFKDAIELFRHMQLTGVMADAILVASVVSICGNLGTLDQGRWLHNYCKRNGIDMNLSVKNALIDMYAKCGDIKKAREIFKNLSKRDVISWTSMISGLAMNGKADEALSLFEQMEKSSHVKPNEVTFLGVLSACSHGGLVDKGFLYLRSMSGKYNLIPRIEHYGCMVDLLGRANLLDEAEKFIQDMPIHPDVVIWRSLLFACRNHGNVKLAEFAAEKINEIDPSGSGENVLLSNMYASVSRWSDVNRIRKGAAAWKTPKQPGCSIVEINGVIHEYFVADHSHSQSDAIYETIFGVSEAIHSERLDLDPDELQACKFSELRNSTDSQTHSRQTEQTDCQRTIFPKGQIQTPQGMSFIQLTDLLVVFCSQDLFRPSVLEQPSQKLSKLEGLEAMIFSTSYKITVTQSFDTDSELKGGLRLK
ncbi:pentatricopeptide repeat-containing protein At2g20540-like [Rutidosis leptorrhynchoides]|uniref:pentatricopeptide repeat-containing protein At2g20540-like n=1 Tax=Rutidosis leptorrhynchoides TaxID=125765 RepID=UPI003A99CE38